jgi:hypothetical protein
VPIHNYYSLSSVSDHGKRKHQGLLESQESLEALKDETRTWIIEFHKNATAKDMHACCSSLPGKISCVYEGHALAFDVIRGSENDLEEMVKACRAVHYASPDSEWNLPDDITENETTGSTSSLLSTSLPWGLDRIDDRLVREDGSYDVSDAGGQGVHVYVADTGIRTTHHDFEGRAIPTLEVLGTVTVCSPTDTSCANDVQGHGTHCAGTVGGKDYGVAAGATLHAVKILTDSGGGSLSWFVESLNWVVQNGVTPAIVSASLGGSGNYQFVTDGVTNTVQNGVVVVVAAGNSNHDACGDTPAHIQAAITVGATRQDDRRAYFSSWGACLDIFAPGFSVKSAGVSSDTSYSIKSGTSMACPHVAGAAALRWAASPSLSATGIATEIISTGTSNVVSDIQGSPNLLLYVEPTPGCADGSPSHHTCSHYAAIGLCGFAPSSRRRAWGGDIAENCQQTCGLCGGTTTTTTTTTATTIDSTLKGKS